MVYKGCDQRLKVARLLYYIMHKIIWTLAIVTIIIAFIDPSSVIGSLAFWAFAISLYIFL